MAGVCVCVAAAALLFGPSPLNAATLGALSLSSASTPVGVAANVLATTSVTDPTILSNSIVLQRMDSLGRILSVTGTFRDDGREGDAVANDRVFSLRFAVLENSAITHIYRVSASVQGSITRIFSAPVNFNVTGNISTGVRILQPANLAFLNTSPIVVSGTMGDPNALVRVNGVTATKSGGTFQVSLPLAEGNNTLTVAAQNSNASVNTDSVQVTLDTTPPRVTVDSPVSGSTTTEASISVAGIVNDIVVGTVNSQQARVTVAGVLAAVANRKYLASNVPLTLGVNNLQIVATDQTGNSASIVLPVTRVAPTKPFIKLFSGNNQSGVVASRLGTPLVAQVLNGSTGVPNVPVTFRVKENDGFFDPAQNKPQLVVVNTDSTGKAQAFLTLGTRAGAGNNVVEAYAPNYDGLALFTASSTPQAAAKINVDSGNNQFGSIGQKLPLPFVAVVTDQGHNRLGNIPVTFTVRQGGGNLNGATSLSTVTDGDGRALAVLTLGSQPGQDNNVVEATFPGNPSFAAAFAATAKAPGDPAQTSISGVVLDNSNNPLPNVSMRLFLTNQGNSNNQPVQIGAAVATNSQGYFKLTGVPVGFFKLMADGTTAGGGTKQYPTLEYDIVTVAGQDNTVGMPIYLPQLDPTARVCVDATTGGVLRPSASPGFSLTIAPGSATFPGGSKTGCVSVTPVNPDKVPMVPGFGQQPRYVVTIQPVGTIFNPPAAITIPNMDGLGPGAKTEMYSFDHDLAAFVAIGSATVSPDGSTISSDPGIGVIKAGWHCGGNPNSTGSAGTCPKCQKCQGPSCVADPAQNNQSPPDDKCKRCLNGATTDIPINGTNTTTTITYGLPSESVTKINDALKNLQKVGVLASVNLLQISGSYSTKECCEASIGKNEVSDGNVNGNFGGFSVKGKIWPPGPFPSFGPRKLSIGVASITVEALFAGGLFLNVDGTVSGKVGRKKDGCSKNAASRAGCFYAEVGTTITLGASAEVNLSGSLKLECTLCTPVTVAVAGNLTLGNFSWPINISSVKYNQPECDSGLSGGTFTAPEGSFKVSAKFAGSIEVDGLGNLAVDETYEFLSCTINTTSGASCTW
jgi:hypothetical protein